MIVQTVLFYLPIMVSAAALPVVFQKLGHPKKLVLLTCLPLIVSVFSLLAALTGEGTPPFGATGLWGVAALCVVLAINPQRAPQRPEDGGRS